MPTKIITVSAIPPSVSSGADYNKGAPLNAVEFDQNLINLRAAVDGKMPLAGSAGQAFTVGALTATSVKLAVSMATANTEASALDFVNTASSGIVAASIKFLTGTSSDTTQITFSTANVYNSLTERMRINSDGSVLIGNTVAVSGAKLEVTGAISGTTITGTAFTASSALAFTCVRAVDTTGFINLQNSTGISQLGVLAGGNAYVGAMTSGKNLSIYASNVLTATVALRSIGINVVPEAWYAYRSAIRVSSTAALWGNNEGYPYGAGLSNNVYYNASDVASYIAANTANELLFPVHAGSKFTWRAAPVGVAGNPITFTQVFSIEKDKTFALQGATTQAGTGITFPAIQSASTNPNTLDDYEEGSFTPVIEGTTSAGAGTYSTQVGHYTKCGNVVHFIATLSWSAHTGTGNMKVAGLPFTALNIANLLPPCNAAVGNITSPTGSTITALITNNTTTAPLYSVVTATGVFAALAIDAVGNLYISGTYFATQ